jgi:hypothetical protein
MKPVLSIAAESHALPIWLPIFRRYVAAMAVTNLIWEVAHLPLYTLWLDGNTREQVLAVIYCTGGDVLIALFSLIGALLVAGRRTWPERSYTRVLLIAVALGVAITIYAEWLAVVVRQSWAYRDLMPTLPPLGTGLTPVLQWLVLPPLCLHWARLSLTARHSNTSLQS